MEKLSKGKPIVFEFDISSVPQPIIRYGIGLWRRRWLVACVAWLLALAGWFLVWLLPDEYESRAQLSMRTETVLDPVMNGVTARPDYSRRVERMTLALLARPNVETVIYRAGLDELIETTNDVERQAALQGLINKVGGRIRVNSPEHMYLELSFRWGNPVVAHDVVDALLNLLIEQDLGASLTESREARRRLEAEVTAYGERLTAKEKEVAAFRRDHATELAIADGNLRRLDTIESDLSRLADELALARQRIISLETVLSATPRTSSGNELDRLMVELAALRSQYEDGHPDIRALQARIDELSGGSDALPQNPEYRRLQIDVRTARDTVSALEKREQSLRAEREALAFTVGQAPEAQAELQRIERDYDQTRKRYEELIERRDRFALTESLGAGVQGIDYQIHERPQIALNPASPPRLLFIFAALVAAIGGGGALAALLTLLERSFTQTSELQTTFNLPVLGALSEVGSDVVRVRRRRDFIGVFAAFAGLALAGAAYTYWSVFRLPDGSAAIVGGVPASGEEALWSD